MADPVKAVLFDKDGTLFDFSASWSAWAVGFLADLSQGDSARAARMAAAIRFDQSAQRFYPDSPLIAGTMEVPVTLLAPHVPHLSQAALRGLLFKGAAAAVMQPAVPLVPLLDRLSARGLVLGVATNDAESIARDHLQAAGVTGHFAHVLGYDSGYTPKPAPDMLLAFADLAGLAPDAVVMVGDSTHDLMAGRAAGMRTIGVLTGLATSEELHPHADVVLPDIGHLPQYLT